MSAELTSLLLRVSADFRQSAEELFAVESQLTGRQRMAAGHYAMTALNLSRGVKDLAIGFGPPPAPPTREQDQGSAMMADGTRPGLLPLEAADEIDEKLGKLQLALYRLGSTLAALGESERSALLHLAPLGCPDLAGLAHQVGEWRERVYGHLIQQQSPSKTDEPTPSASARKDGSHAP